MREHLPPGSHSPSSPAVPQSPDGQTSAPISLRRVSRLFSRPARIQASDFIRREISARMQDRLMLIKIEPTVVIDAGCGAGADLPFLQQRFTDALTIGIDISETMVAIASALQQGAARSMTTLFKSWLTDRQLGRSSLICADFGAFPVKTDSASLIWSNLALQWHPAPHQMFKEWRRVLSPNGVLMFSALGPDTFTELRQAYQCVDIEPPVLPFVDLHDYGDMLVGAGFSTPVMDMERLTLTYTSPAALLADVAAFGGNPLDTVSGGLSGKWRHAQVVQAIEAMRRPDGTIPLTLEVLYGHAFRPVSRQASNHSVVKWHPKSS